jgi:hypothetical protein
MDGVFLSAVIAANVGRIQLAAAARLARMQQPEALTPPSSLSMLRRRTWIASRASPLARAGISTSRFDLWRPR